MTEADNQADLMLSMAECFPTYGAAAVRERGTELWEGIKTEVSQAFCAMTLLTIRYSTALMARSRRLR
jgi:hypothetical protein